MAAETVMRNRPQTEEERWAEVDIQRHNLTNREETGVRIWEEAIEIQTENLKIKSGKSEKNPEEEKSSSSIFSCCLANREEHLGRQKEKRAVPVTVCERLRNAVQDNLSCIFDTVGHILCCHLGWGPAHDQSSEADVWDAAHRWVSGTLWKHLFLKVQTFYSTTATSIAQ